MRAEDHLLLTVADTAEVLRVSRITVYRLIWAGVLRPVYIGRAVRIPRAEVERFVMEAQERERVATR